MRARWAATGSVLILATGLLAACGDDTCNPGESCPAPTGTFSLETVSGGSLPSVLFQEGNDRLEITEGSLSLNADETFSMRITLRIVVDGDVETEELETIGTVSATGNQLDFSSDDFDFTAVRSGNDISFTLPFEIDGDIEDVSFVFRK